MDSSYMQIVEKPELPDNTLIAPFRFARELRLQLKDANLTILSGEDTAVHLSSNLVEAFDEWSAELT